MFLRRLAVAGKRFAATMAQSMTPVEDAMRAKETFKPTTLEIFNDSHKHAHHQAMQGVTSRETHFRVIITSEAFKSKMQIARHRLVNAVLKDELSREGGIHALQLKTRTPDEEGRQTQKDAAEQ
ncbi:bola-domain-containing protein [Trematosphaeria pertusa]|uniref:Bola-domain-containing protein n=1 Tax=Trematosphaeria pertusa TaxID=390896 RepID=A0A6A6IVM2_9PLEO|nr:bola-domain-containing protein [Trematosphaeria pertusa]KAF2254464.1 bola-domain-containing protein [Trematosphaeria pertusa]